MQDLRLDAIAICKSARRGSDRHGPPVTTQDQELSA